MEAVFGPFCYEMEGFFDHLIWSISGQAGNSLHTSAAKWKQKKERRVVKHDHLLAVASEARILDITISPDPRFWLCKTIEEHWIFLCFEHTGN